MPTLIILTKYPTPWEVKTRLWASIWMQKAALFQRTCLHKLIQTHQQQPYALLIWLKQPEKIKVFCEEFGIQETDVFAQQWDDLGAIMHHALSYGLSKSSSAYLIWSDVPLISPETIIQAYSTLARRDTVLGPAHDGGYYLLWSKHSIPEVITGMTYSTETVYQETCDRIEQYWYSLWVLPEMIDIDTIQALRQAAQDDASGWIQNTVTTLEIDM